MGNALRALRLAARDFWEESLTLILLGLIGGILIVLVLPIPFVLAAHYGVAARIPEQRTIGWRDWVAVGRAHAPFFYRWFLLVLGITLLFLGSAYFYTELGATWALALSGLSGGLLLLWWLPQPFVPALYFQQEDRSLRTTLRNATVLAFSNPAAPLILWGSLIALFFPLSYIAVPLLLLLAIWMALYSTRVVWRQLGHPDYV